jgi:hypothetical protein
MQRHTLDTGYPGLEKEQVPPNTSGLRMPAQTPANSPLAGRQEKPGARSAARGRGWRRRLQPLRVDWPPRLPLLTHKASTTPTPPRPALPCRHHPHAPPGRGPPRLRPV